MFKVGDTVECLNDTYSFIKKGETAVIKKFQGDGDMVFQHFENGLSYHPRDFCLSWKPQNGEKVICTQDNNKRTFIGMDDGCYVCANVFGYNKFNSVRQPPQNHTITIGGIDTELSHESIVALKKTLNKLDI